MIFLESPTESFLLESMLEYTSPGVLMVQEIIYLLLWNEAPVNLLISIDLDADKKSSYWPPGLTDELLVRLEADN